MEKYRFAPLKHLDINAIIFDLGGIVLDIDYQLTLRAFQRLGVEHLQEVYTFAAQDEAISRFERGQMTPAEFVSELQRLLGHGLDYVQAVQAWNAMILPWSPQRMALLERLALRYELYLLSNTNVLHRDAFEPALLQHTGRALSSYFGQVYYSFELGMRKPEPRIFRHVLAHAQLDPARTLFIDDNAANVAAAQAVGLAAYRIDPAHERIDELFEAES